MASSVAPPVSRRVAFSPRRLCETTRFTPAAWQRQRTRRRRASRFALPGSFVLRCRSGMKVEQQLLGPLPCRGSQQNRLVGGVDWDRAPRALRLGPVDVEDGSAVVYVARSQAQHLGGSAAGHDHPGGSQSQGIGGHQAGRDEPPGSAEIGAREATAGARTIPGLQGMARRQESRPRAGMAVPGAPAPTLEGPTFERPAPHDIRAFEPVVDGGLVHYRLAGERGSPAFTDRGKVIDIRDSNRRETVLAALQLSAQKWGTLHGARRRAVPTALRRAGRGARVQDRESRAAAGDCDRAERVFVSSVSTGPSIGPRPRRSSRRTGCTSPTSPARPPMVARIRRASTRRSRCASG